MPPARPPGASVSLPSPRCAATMRRRPIWRLVVNCRRTRLVDSEWRGADLLLPSSGGGGANLSWLRGELRRRRIESGPAVDNRVKGGSKFYRTRQAGQGRAERVPAERSVGQRRTPGDDAVGACLE
jgi:hypothetical protein